MVSPEVRSPACSSPDGEPGRAAWRIRRGLIAAGVAVWSVGAATPALAQCYPIAEGPAQILPAGYQPAALPAGSVRLTFLGHSSFLIETPQGASAITDYNGMVRAAEPPDLVTMNNAHSSHYTDFVDSEIGLVLRGWDPAGGVALHDVTHLDLHVRNVPTSVREFGGARINGNSIFVFEIADLCIAHLGHLHHLLTDVHLGELGQIDVLLVPVDGSYTMAQQLMVEVIDQIRPSLVIPMHYFSAYTLAGFLELVRGRYEVVVKEEPTVVLTRTTLPYRQILVLPGG
ncbi:MAG TPA: MBL fold metallo-hydrolase [Geminicoccaceae bacterium]|nr:MBL fold metallo-hydrolase [Geminicoccaceae bacterium]